MLDNVIVANLATGSTDISEFILANIIESIRTHDVDFGDGPISVEIDCLVSVCLGCDTTVMAATPEDRDMHAQWTDTTCHAHQTYGFMSKQV